MVQEASVKPRIIGTLHHSICRQDKASKDKSTGSHRPSIVIMMRQALRIYQSPLNKGKISMSLKLRWSVEPPNFKKKRSNYYQWINRGSENLFSNDKWIQISSIIILSAKKLKFLKKLNKNPKVEKRKPNEIKIKKSWSNLKHHLQNQPKITTTTLSFKRNQKL